ncbi:S8 family serine peptidase [uncultured Jatrophihabitans sp.]|uniref:S8 family serine peptidase n=1 Tax=uncultured Jatrophihabitans sp. TaxID=1610747 RepID=UPI0035C9B7E0
MLASLVLAASGLVTAQPAAARTVPKGAAWYGIYQLQKAWKVSEGAGVTVAVIDSRVNTAVGDLQGQTVTPIELPGSDSAYETLKGYSHGTDMAVKIAGSGAGGGMVGVAPRAKILPINVGAGGDQTVSDLLPSAIRAAVSRGARVINVSLGSESACNPASEGAAIRYAYQHGVIVVVSAGDDPGAVDNPANCPGALAIGGVDAAGKRWTKTPSGPEIDFVSQAYDLVNEQLNQTLGGPYPGNSGTSSSAAFVSGMFALLISHFPHDSMRRIVARAIYWTHTGRGTAGIDKRIDNYLGYGELLPYQTLTQDVPANAPNPIFDAWDRDFGSARSSSGSSSHPSASPSASPTDGASSTASASGGSGGGISPAAVAVLVVVVVVLAVGVVIIVVRRRRPRATSGLPPAPPPGYGR